MMVYGICEWCGKQTQSKYKSTLKRFCSYSCSTQYKWNTNRQRKEYIQVTCMNCGKEFSIYKSDHRILEGQTSFCCSTKCAGELVKKNRPTRICPVCGSAFTSSRKTKPLVCSKGCYTIYLKYRQYKKHHEKNITLSSFIELLGKGNPFVYSGREKEYMKEYTTANKKILNAQRLAKSHSSELIEYTLRLKKNIGALYKRRGRTNATIEKILGCTASEFIAYIDSKLTEGMTVDNYGEWQLDHIIPLSEAKSIDDVNRLCHYTNYQPLWAKDNRAKSNKLITET